MLFLLLLRLMFLLLLVLPAVFVAVDMLAVFCFWLLRFLLRSFRFSSSARWLSRCRACVAVAELFAAAAAGDTLRCCFLALLSCPPPLVLVLVMLYLFVVFFFR